MNKAKFYVLGPSVVTVYGGKSEVRGKLGDTIIGPFRSKAGADYFKLHPEVLTIAAAERAVFKQRFSDNNVTPDFLD